MVDKNIDNYARYLERSKMYDPEHQMVISFNEAQSILELLEHEFIPYNTETIHIVLGRMAAFVGNRKK